MTKIKTSELTSAALDWAVAKCELAVDSNVRKGYGNSMLVVDKNDFGHPARYSTDWAQGGPIIERDELSVRMVSTKTWGAWHYENYKEETHTTGPTPLIAAMRCYVASTLGDEVEVPDELLGA